ncbi:MAG: hypothetical protein JXJ04_26585 [Spirochaetales bacterium]|nr:hypothetical protein [Spirochaetales bacterium]
MENKLIKQATFSILFLFFLIYPLYPDIRYYKSNDIGMKLKQITLEEISSFEYVLSVEDTTEPEERKLYSKNELVKRWELSFYNNKNKREEREFDKETLTNLRYYDRRGRLVEEQLYSEKQAFNKIIYTYGENQQLFQAKAYNNEQVLIYSENYDFNQQGMIRKVKRLWTDGRFQTSSFVYGQGRLIEEVFSTNEGMTISRYNKKDKLSNSEVWKDEALIKKTFFTYNEEGSLLSSLEKDLVGGLETEDRYNEEGRLQKEIVTKNNVKIIEDSYFYNNEGRKSKMNRISDRGLEEWAFYYNPEGELNREEYSQRGVLEKRTIYTSDNSYYEELFRYGELLVRVYYEDETKVKEEFLENGEVIRVNSLVHEE